MTSLKLWMSKVSQWINKRTFTGRTVTSGFPAVGKSFQNGYCNFYVLIPYQYDQYTVTFNGANIINVGGSFTLANDYGHQADYVYLRLQHSGFSLNQFYLGTVSLTLHVGGGST